MKKKKPIIVWMNGKKTKIASKNNKKNTYPIGRELAATIDDSTNKDDKIPALTRQHNEKKGIGVKQKSRFSMYKPIIIATVSAVVIGLCMGIIMLNMFVGIGKEVYGNGNSNNLLTNNTTVNGSSTDGEKTDQALQTVIFEQINGFVLQAGVFSSKANADKWSKKYEQAGFPTMVWNKNEQYFLLAGMASTEEQAKIHATNLKENAFDIYVKEWNTGEVEKKLTKEEGEWVHSFRDVWYESVMAVTGNDKISTASWKDVIDRYPNQSDRLSSLFKSLKDSYKQFGEVNQQKAQIILLKQWKQYEETVIK